jgi:hypothetical protein
LVVRDRGSYVFAQRKRTSDETVCGGDSDAKRLHGEAAPGERR